MNSDKTTIPLHKQAKAGLKSLLSQASQVSLGLMVMLVVTGGLPPGWIIAAGFFVGVGFVAWRESKRQSELVMSIKTEENESRVRNPL